MKIKLLIIILVFCCSCSRNIIGTYKHNICCSGPNCYILILKEGNRFEYKYYHDLGGTGIIYGHFTRRFNKLNLKPILPFEYKLQNSSTSIVLDKNSDSTTIQLYELCPIVNKINDSIYKTYNLPKYKLNQIDTLKSSSLTFTLNNRTYLPDTNGIARVKLRVNDTIKVKQFFSNDDIFKYVVKNKDINKLNIYCAVKPYIPEMFDYIVKKYRIKKNGLFPLAFESEMIVLGDYSFFNKYKCLKYNEKNAIQDTLFKLINQRIDKKIFDLDYFNNDFIIFFNTFGKVNKVLFTDEYGSKFERRLYNFKERKKRQMIKQAIENYIIPDFNKIKYDFRIRLKIHEEEKTKEWELDI